MKLHLELLPDSLAICRLPHDAEHPRWISGAFTSITRTPEELSIVCDDSCAPDDVQVERGWRLLRVRGPIPFDVTGVAAAFTAPLAEAGISLFPIATWDTDYLLVKAALLEAAIATLRRAGHTVS